MQPAVMQRTEPYMEMYLEAYERVGIKGWWTCTCREGIGLISLS
jgi:hypothetical protein